MARIICDYCGTEYDDTMQRCPLCGTVNETAAEEEPAREERPDRQRPDGLPGVQHGGKLPAGHGPGYGTCGAFHVGAAAEPG